MLAKKSKTGAIPDGDYSYELKWDGIRAIFVLRDQILTIFSRSGRDISRQFPELVRTAPRILANGVYDAEICCHNEEHIPSFPLVTSRLHLGSHHKEASRTNPATAYIFDILELDDQKLLFEAYSTRREYLADAIRGRSLYWEMSKRYDDGEALLRRARAEGREGIMAKLNSSPYYEGKRRAAWTKVKIKFHEDVLVVGYTDGTGKRSGFFGALILEDLEGHLCGRVGTGFTDEILAYVFSQLQRQGIRETSKGIRWLRRALTCEIEYMRNTGGARREPVFRRLIEEKGPSAPDETSV